MQRKRQHEQSKRWEEKFQLRRMMERVKALRTRSGKAECTEVEFNVLSNWPLHDFYLKQPHFLTVAFFGAPNTVRVCGSVISLKFEARTGEWLMAKFMSRFICIYINEELSLFHSLSAARVDRENRAQWPRIATISYGPFSQIKCFISLYLYTHAFMLYLFDKFSRSLFQVLRLSFGLCPNPPRTVK